MPYNEKTADRVRVALSHLTKVEEKRMFRGLCFMVNGKMCVCVSGEELMCRVGPHVFSELAEKPGTRTMKRNGATIGSYLYVAEEGFKSKRDFDFWINACLAFNAEAKSSKVKPTPKTQKRNPSTREKTTRKTKNKK